MLGCLGEQWLVYHWLWLVDVVLTRSPRLLVVIEYCAFRSLHGCS